MAISKFSKRICTVLRGQTNKEFEWERMREDEKEAQTARRLIRLGLLKVQEDRLKLAKSSGSIISKLRNEEG